MIACALASGCGGSARHASSAAGGTAGPGTAVHLPVPAMLRRLPLTDQFGKRVSLNSWSGRTVLLVPFLTLCQDICPMTTGNLVSVEHSLALDRAGPDVQIVELTVDPERDTPARLKAYARLTGADWELVTESPRVLRMLGKFFGFYYQRVPEDDPDARDWWTGRPLTYDVDHTDNYFVIDPDGVELVVQVAGPDFHGRLNPRLYAFLDALGRAYLKHPPQPDWTPADAVSAVAVGYGRALRAHALS